MTAQIERNPRQGCELSTTLPIAVLVYLAMTICCAAVGVAAWAVLAKAPAPAAIAAVITGVAWLVGAILEGCRNAE